MKDQLGGVKSSWDHSMCRVDHLFPPPPFYLSDLWRELYKESPGEQFLNAQCCCHSDLWHTGSHHCHHQRHHIPSSSYPEKEKVDPFFRLSPWLISVRSLGFWEFSNSPFEHPWPQLMRSSLPSGHHENRLIWVDLGLMALLEIASFKHLSRGPASRLIVLRTISSE
jgi:hypothetical protein